MSRPCAVVLCPDCKGGAGRLRINAAISTVFPSPISSPASRLSAMCWGGGEGGEKGRRLSADQTHNMDFRWNALHLRNAA